MNDILFEDRKEQYIHLRNIYWQKYKELQQLKNDVEQSQRDMQQVCTHEWTKDWEERGRSRWFCKHCDKLR